MMSSFPVPDLKGHTVDPNLVTRVLWLFSQWVGTGRDSGVLEFVTTGLLR